MKLRATCSFWMIETDADPEFADIDNPRGVRVVDQHFVLVEDLESGARWQGPPAASRDGGERLAAAMQRSIDKGHNPTQGLQEMQPCYGSTAYESGNWESFNREMERREIY